MQSQHRTVWIEQTKIRVTLRPPDEQRTTWTIDYRLPTGRRRRISTRTEDPARALQFLDALIKHALPQDLKTALEESEQQRAAPTHNPRLRQLADYYVDIHLPNKNAAPKTLTAARRITRDFLDFCSDHRIGTVQQLSRAKLDEYAATLRQEGKAPKTVKNALVMIRAMFNAAVDADLLDKSPIKQWQFPKVHENEVTILTHEQMRDVLTIIRTKAPTIYPIIQWIAKTGNRPSDAIDLRWKQLDLENRAVIRTQIKTKRLAKYCIPDTLADELARHKIPDMTDDSHVFTNSAGQPFTINALYRTFTRTLEREDYRRKVTLKDLRHTYASVLINDVGCPLPTVQIQMGHASINTTMKYVRPSTGMKHLDAFAKLLD